jgi:hypothetical protein
MLIREIIVESSKDEWICHDKLGGFVKIRPDPRISSKPDTFSMSYINNTIAKFYGVSPRILGYDSHGHRGLPQPHLHGFSTSRKDGYFKMDQSVLNHDYRVSIKIFFGLYTTLIHKYKQDNL